MSRKLALSLAVSLALVPCSVRAFAVEDAPPAVSARPAASIKVAILPVTAAWIEPDEPTRNEKAAQGTEELTRLFADRGFALADAESVTKALDSLKLDLSRPENRTRPALDKLGEALGADWVVLVTVTELTQQRVKAPITDTDELVTCATIQTWVVDRAEGKSLLGGERSSCPLHSDPSSRKPKNAIGAAAREALRAVLAPFPVRKDRAD